MEIASSEAAGRRGWRVPGIPSRGTTLRRCFDILFGVLLPPVLIILDNEWDPLGQGGIQVLPLRPYSPLLAHAAILGLAVWWLLRGRIEWLGAFAAGPLLAGAAFALGAGILLLPLSAIGTMMFGLGLLGLVPLVTGLVFLDAGLEALHSGRHRLGTAPALGICFCTALLFGGACAGAGRVVRILELRETSVLSEERRGDPERAVTVLRVLRTVPGIGLARLEWTARAAEGGDPDLAKRLTEAYERITGHPLPVVD